VRVHDQPFGLVPPLQGAYGIVGHLRMRGNPRKNPPVRTSKLELAVGLSSELIALFVNRAMVAAAKHGQIRERGGPALRPVTDMMALAKAHSAAREATATVSMMQHPPKRRRNRARSGRHLHDPTVDAVLHHHPARVARQALRRFRRNARTTLEDRLTRLIGVREHGRVDMDDHLIALARRARIDAVMERGLRE